MSFLDLPVRASKPRKQGLTVLIDNGYPLTYFRDVLESLHPYIDLVKLGWGSSLITPKLDEKLACLRDVGIDYFFGGSLYEKAVLQGKLDAYVDFCKEKGCRWMECSNGTIELSNSEKAAHIEQLCNEFQILSEVGYKDVERSLNLSPRKWVEFVQEDLRAGAKWVITEARESGKSGICRENGELRLGLIEEIIESGVRPEQLIFEAPTKKLQVFFVQKFGSDVNLANISFQDVTSLESLRLGLRADTLEDFEEARA